MEMIITVLLFAYLIIGFVYAVWVFLFAYDRWYWFPINWLLGVPVILMDLYFVLAKKKNPLGKL